MKTNKEKYDYYKNLLDIEINKFLDSVERTIPEVIYKVSSSGKIAEYKPVIKKENAFLSMYGLNYTFIDVNFSYLKKNDKPTRQQVNDIRNFVNNHLQSYIFKIDNVNFLVEEINKTYGSSYTGFSMKYLSKGNEYGDMFFADLDEALSLSQERKIKHDEIYLAKDNQFNCDYCRKATDNSKKVTRKITSIQNYGHGGRVMNFCSGECAFNEQCAMEG